MVVSRKETALLSMILATVLVGSPGVFTNHASAASLEELAEGRRIYEGSCAICHGSRGQGRGMAAHMFITKPRDFTPGLFKFRSTPSGSLPADEDLIRTITKGLTGTPMVAQSHLTREQLRALVSYVKTFSSRFSEETPPAPVPVGESPPANAALLAKGRDLYRDAGCGDCHGAEGLGDGPSAGDLKDDWGYRILPGDLTTPLKRGSSTRAIYRTLVTGLDGTPMPSYQDALTEEQLWALASYVSSLNTGIPSFQQRQEQMRGRHVLRMHGPGGGMMHGPPRRMR